MDKYIIGYGRVTDIIGVYAASLEDARAKAVQLSLAAGVSAEEAGEEDISWAEPWDSWRASDFGLAVWDESFDARAAPMAGRPKDGWEIVEAKNV